MKRSRLISGVLLGISFVLVSLSAPHVRAQAGTVALPQVFKTFAGDPRLEPLPDGPIHLQNIQVFTTDQFGGVHTLDMRFPPRVNGQNQSDGDKHADMYVLFDAATGVEINQPMIIEAAPKGASAGVTDLKARLFSPIWELHAVLVDSTYDPADLAQRIDSSEKIYTSPKVKQIVQTNIFLNCPVVPNGTTVDVGSAQPEQVFFEGEMVTIVPYDIEDGGFNVQILFKFEDQSGHTLGRSLTTGAARTATAPDPDFVAHLVTSHAIGDPFYTSIWDLWTVVVPDGTDVSQVKSNVTVRDMALNKKLWTLKSSGIRLNCPVVKIDGIQVPVEDARHLLATNPSGPHTFKKNKFPFDIPPVSIPALASTNPDGTTRPFLVFKSRTFQITEINPGGVPAPIAAHATNGFPDVTPEIGGKGNVIPLILKDPLLQDPTIPISSGPATNGEINRINQAELDAAFPKLPDAFEATIAKLIAAGNLDPSWAPGIRPYQERLSALGRAVFELFWMPEQGGNQKDVTTCLPCHSMPAAGGSARGLYNLERPIAGANSGAATQSNPGGMFGGGSAELLAAQVFARNPGAARSAVNPNGVLGAGGSQGTIVSLRADVAGASNTHFGIESTERIMTTLRPGITEDAAALLDLDGDGVVNEMTVGEVTAEAAFLLTLPVPDEANDDVKAQMGISTRSVQRGRQLFRKSIANGGIGCATCHTPFIKFNPELQQLTLNNPATHVPLTLDLPYQTATLADVQEGYADFISQRGLRLYGDFNRHEMGANMSVVGGNSISKTAELWSVGSDAPLFRNGSMGFNLKGAILAHGGEGLNAKNAFAALTASQQQDIVNFLRVQLVQGQRGEGSGAIPPRPNNPPTASADKATTDAGAPVIVAVLANDTDLDGDSLLLTDVSGVVGGSAVIRADGRVTFTPSLGFSGIASFTYTVTDSRGSGAIGTVTVTVLPAPSGAPRLVAAYNFDEADGTAVLDASGNANNGTIQNATRAAGRVGGAVSFSGSVGSPQWVTVGDAASLHLTTGMTLEAWVNPSALGGWRTVVQKERMGGLAYSLYADDGAPDDPSGTVGPSGYARMNFIDQPIRTGTALPLGTWSHLAVTYDGTKLCIYVNGALVSSREQTGIILVSDGALRIGGNSQAANEFFNGLIDDVRIYNYALGATQILADMSTPVTPPIPPTP